MVPWLPAGTRRTVVPLLHPSHVPGGVPPLRHGRHVVRFRAGIRPKHICNQQCCVTGRRARNLGLTSRGLHRDAVARAAGELRAGASARVVRLGVGVRREPGRAQARSYRRKCNNF